MSTSCREQGGALMNATINGHALTAEETAVLFQALHAGEHIEQTRATMIVNDGGEQKFKANAITALLRKLDRPKAAPTKSFMENGWSFRPMEEGGGFRVYGPRNRSSAKAWLYISSDKSAWMFCAYDAHGRGRQDARSTFAEAKAAILKILGNREKR